MKRRQITAIIAALALAVTSTALLTGCVGKSYYYKVNDDGSLERVGEIKKHTEDESSVESTVSTSDESKEEKSEVEESSEEEKSEEESKEESKEESEEAPGGSDEDVLAVLTVEMPTDWDAQEVVFKITDSNDKSASPEVKSEGDGVFSCTVSKFADDGEAFVDAKFNVLFKKGGTGTSKTTEDTMITGTKTYVAVQDGKKYTLSEK
ncbi:MAG: hypothetical protein IJU51_00545 [Clostridia bacterium]|nr:hypothetical protein [Clostridia bacterium]